MNDSKPLKVASYSISFQEVPKETSLVLNISGCNHHCKNCHSQYLWEYTGTDLKECLSILIRRYESFITCVCFMGGDQNINDLINASQYIHSNTNLKVCLYSGEGSYTVKGIYLENLLGIHFDYLKIGPYIENLGGLDKETTNQKFYKAIDFNKIIDITSEFRTQKKELL